MADMKILDNDELSEVSGGDIEVWQGSNYVCPQCGDELIRVVWQGYVSIYYRCFTCSDDFSLEEIEGKKD